MRRGASGTLLALLLAACSGPDGPATEDGLEAVEVGGGIDAGLDVEDDPRAVRPAPKLIGVLPGDYPDDLPVFIPSSLVDFGDLPQEAGGGRYIELQTHIAKAKVEQQLAAQMVEKGWQRDGEKWSKEERRVGIEISGERPTLIRVSYPRR